MDGLDDKEVGCGICIGDVMGLEWRGAKGTRWALVGFRWGLPRHSDSRRGVFGFDVCRAGI